jgi:repressor LexA
MKGRYSSLDKLTPEEVKARNLETYGSKVKYFRNRAGLSADQLADILQISKSSIRNWECGLTRPDPEYLYQMFSIFDVEPNDFFGIKGIGAILTDQEKALLADFRSLDKRGKRDLTTYARAMADRMNLQKMAETYYRIGPVDDYGRKAAAGSSGADWADYPEKEQLLLYNCSTVRSADEIVTVSGDSMEPQFHNGDKVLVKYCDELRNGDIGVFFVHGVGGVIKQKAYDRLHSLNPDYDDIFPYEEGAKLIGRVVGKITQDMIPTSEEQKLYLDARQVYENDPEAFDDYRE